MTRQHVLSICLMASVCLLYAQDPSRYFGLSAPDSIPEKLAPGVISMPDEYEFGSVFSKDGKEFFYGVDIGPRNEIRYCKYEGGRWTESKAILADEKFSFNDPMLSNDGLRLYFISNLPISGNQEKDIDIWYIDRSSGTWSEPINAGPNINSERKEFYISFAANGAMYFASNKEAPEDYLSDFDIYRSAYVDGTFQKPERLSFNTTAYEADVYVAPDESYVIFCATKRSSLGRGDLYISFQQDGHWTQPQNMGEPINDPGHQLCPFVTYDGKYFLYTSNKDLYWVSTNILTQFEPQ